MATKNRKIGRNAKWCQRYRAMHQRERNKVLRLRRHLASFPNDPCGRRALARAEGVLHPSRAAP